MMLLLALALSSSPGLVQFHGTSAEAAPIVEFLASRAITAWGAVPDERFSVEVTMSSSAAYGVLVRADGVELDHLSVATTPRALGMLEAWLFVRRVIEAELRGVVAGEVRLARTASVATASVAFAR